MTFQADLQAARCGYISMGPWNGRRGLSLFGPDLVSSSLGVLEECAGQLDCPQVNGLGSPTLDETSETGAFNSVMRSFGDKAADHADEMDVPAGPLDGDAK